MSPYLKSFLKHTNVYSPERKYIIHEPKANHKKEPLIWGTLRSHLYNGSLSVEASVSLMLSLLAIFSVLLMFVAMKKQVAISRVMYEAVEDAKVYSAVMDDDMAAVAIVADSKVRAMVKGVGDATFTVTKKEQGLIYKGYFTVKLPFPYGTMRNLKLTRTLILESFSEAVTDEETEYVYITRSGKVYHTSLACPHLNITIMETTKSSIASKRNKGGGKYKPCEVCVHNGACAIVYYTPEGDRYHNKKDCRSLLRDIRKVPLKEVIDTYRQCLDCGKKLKE